MCRYWRNLDMILSLPTYRNRPVRKKYKLYYRNITKGLFDMDKETIIIASEYKEELSEHFGRVPEVAKPLLKGAKTVFSQIEKSLYTAPAFINAVKAAVPDVTLQAMLTDEQKQQIAKGALKLMTKKDGSLMANLISLETKKIVATHNHPEGIKGAQATAAVIFLARTGHSKPEIKQYVEQTFGYDLNRTCDEIRPTYHHVETCQETVPEAIIAFLESVSFEDALRNTVSLGGDSDTLACITGGIAEAFYGMPQELRDETLKRLPEDIREAYELFRWNIGQR